MLLPPPPLHGTTPTPDASPERARIVTAALALYLHQGIAAVEATDVARYLRLAEERVHHWFADKATLVAAAIEAHAPRSLPAQGAEQQFGRGVTTTAQLGQRGDAPALRVVF